MCDVEDRLATRGRTTGDHQRCREGNMKTRVVQRSFIVHGSLRHSAKHKKGERTCPFQHDLDNNTTRMQSRQIQQLHTRHLCFPSLPEHFFTPVRVPIAVFVPVAINALPMEQIGVKSFRNMHMTTTRTLLVLLAIRLVNIINI